MHQEIIRKLDELLRAAARRERQQDRIERKIDTILNLEIYDMATSADLKALSEALLVKAQANTDATSAVATAMADVKALYAKAIADLEAATAANDPAALDAAMANLNAIGGMIDADTLAEAALANTGTPV